MWLADFRELLALSPISAERVRQLIFSKYPDSGWASEYGFTIWCAYCYLAKHRASWEEPHLAVIGKKSGLIKNSLLVALYEPFLSSPIKIMPNLDFDVNQIASKAREIEAKFPDLPADIQ
jgi:hypothetical protein